MKCDNVKIIPLREESFSILEDLIKQQQQFHYELDPENNAYFLEIGVEEFMEYMTKEADHRCFVAIDETTRKPCGFIAATISVLEDLSTFEAFIEDVFVEEKFRSAGVASDLMYKLFISLNTKLIKTIRVHVTKGNEEVFAFYGKFGFRFEENDENGYILKKEINAGNIVYKDTKNFAQQELVDLFTSVGWIEFSANFPQRLVGAMKQSDTVYSAYDGNRLVGLISAIDDSMHVFIVYLLVSPEYQHMGVGSTLLNKMLSNYPNHRVILTTDDDTVGYYSKLGFEKDSVGLVKEGLVK